jgi:hypothetical protein
MRSRLIALSLLLLSATAVHAQVSVQIRLPSASIGLNVPFYPQLVPVPGYPVYYAPNVHSNYFFYDGFYWVYQNDNWYASAWYNGPWDLVAREIVPVFILRIPVGYYRNPPRHFHGWRGDAPPRWGVRWGARWEHDRHGWDRWDRRAYVAPAPLPYYQREYSGRRYPHEERQQRLQEKHYRYRSHEHTVVRQHPDRNERPASVPREHPRMQRPAPPSQSSPQTGESRRGQEQRQHAHRERRENRDQDRGR